MLTEAANYKRRKVITPVTHKCECPERLCACGCGLRAYLVHSSCNPYRSAASASCTSLLCHLLVHSPAQFITLPLLCDVQGPLTPR